MHGSYSFNYIRANRLFGWTDNVFMACQTELSYSLFNNIQWMEYDAQSEAVLGTLRYGESPAWNSEHFVLCLQTLIKRVHIKSLGKDEPDEIPSSGIHKLHLGIQFTGEDVTGQFHPFLETD